MRARRPFFEGQLLHLLALAALVAVTAWACTSEAVRKGGLWGLPSSAWLWLCVGNAALHQAYVWLGWRLELHGGHLTRRFGARAFGLFAVGFTLLIVARPVLAVLLARANAGSLDLGPWLGRVLPLVLALPVAYVGWSVQRYFGVRRAYGADHFDPAYRTRGMVRGGIFRWTPNAMYVFGFLILWIPALWAGSAGGLVAALLSHLYIGVHWLATERPDMEVIYGGGR